jgi:rare lipoprotein A
VTISIGNPSVAHPVVAPQAIGRAVRPCGLRLLCLLALAALAAAPAAASADPPASGGAEAPPPGSTGGTVSAEGSVAITARAGTMLRRVARFRGSVPAAEAGRTVTVERFDELGQAWIAVATATVAGDGSYLARWRADRSGRHRVRAVLHRPGAATAASASAEVTVTVHRSARATWYGPGFYGRRTACGQKMTRSLVGVAHKRLPCGTQVALLYRGRTITVPVVDRGPFRPGTRWDLTSATAEALGFEHTDRVGAVRIR